jgi:hypothetical protein
MEDINFQNSTIADYLPYQANWSNEIRLSADVKRRETVEIIPAVSSVNNISSTNSGNQTEIKIADSMRALDCDSSYLEFYVGGVNIPAPAGGNTNLVVLDGPFAPISRLTLSVHGMNISGSVTEFNKHATARFINQAMTQNVANDWLSLNAGAVKFLPLIQNIGSQPTCTNFYGFLGVCPQNMIPKDASTATAANYDGLGFVTPQANGIGLLGTNGNLYKSYLEPNNSSQKCVIPLKELHGFFATSKYLPLFLLDDVILTIQWASPQSVFMSDCGVPKARAAGPPIVGAYNLSSSLSSYSVTNIKVVADLVTLSDSLVNTYKMMSQSEEGFLIPYDDWSVQSFSYTSSYSSRVFQVQQSTSNLKSVLFYQQPKTIQSSQANWSNSHFPYLGITNFSMLANNTNIPNNPLNSFTDMIAYSQRSRGTLDNPLAQFLANNMWVSGYSESAPTQNAGGGNDGAGTDIPACLTSFLLYFNLEKILNEPVEVVANGLDLKSGSSTLTLKWNEFTNDNVLNPASTIKYNNLLGADRQYTVYCQMTFARAILLNNGQVKQLG